jgi:hypothetical protein
MFARSFAIDIGNTYACKSAFCLLQSATPLSFGGWPGTTARTRLRASLLGSGQLLARRLQHLLGDLLFHLASGGHGKGHVGAGNAKVHRLAEMVLETGIAVAGNGRSDGDQFLDCG